MNANDVPVERLESKPFDRRLPAQRDLEILMSPNDRLKRNGLNPYLSWYSIFVSIRVILVSLSASLLIRGWIWSVSRVHPLSTFAFIRVRSRLLLLFCDHADFSKS